MKRFIKEDVLRILTAIFAVMFYLKAIVLERLYKNQWDAGELFIKYYQYVDDVLPSMEFLVNLMIGVFVPLLIVKYYSNKNRGHGED